MSMSEHYTHKPLIIGADVGGTKVSVLVVDSLNNVLGQATQPTPLDSPEGTLAGIVSTIESTMRNAGASFSDIERLGVGIPGHVNHETGVVRQAVNLGWDEVPVGEWLSAQLGVRCVLENDVRLAALGVQRYLRQLGNKSADNLAYIGVGTGIAAGLVLDGRLYRGAHAMAGEIGHMIIEPGGALCACGARGCLETLASGPAIARMGEEAGLATRGAGLGGYEPPSAEDVYRAARQGDEAALTITRRVGSYLALAAQQLIVAYDMECIVFGGGVSREGDAFLRPILEALARLRESSALTGEMLGPDDVSVLPPDYEAGAWGAVILAGGAHNVPAPGVDGREGGDRQRASAER
jgi:glucokinase